MGNSNLISAQSPVGGGNKKDGDIFVIAKYLTKTLHSLLVNKNREHKNYIRLLLKNKKLIKMIDQGDPKLNQSKIWFVILHTGRDVFRRCGLKEKEQEAQFLIDQLEMTENIYSCEKKQKVEKLGFKAIYPN
jgi:hypothetical protein